MKKIKVGLIGAGFMGRTHSNAYKSINNIFGDEVVPELTAVADVNADNAKALAERYGFQRCQQIGKKLLPIRKSSWLTLRRPTLPIARLRWKPPVTASTSIVKSRSL